MKKKYDKEANCLMDVVKNIECVNLSVGANNRESFAWILNNFELFQQESIESYNKIICSILHKEKTKLYFIVHDEKDTEFSAVEKHLGIWHRFKGIPINNKSKGFYANGIRYAYAELGGFKLEQISILHCGEFVFLKEDIEIDGYMKKLTKEKSVFDAFYDNGYLIARFRNLWTDGNALAFYSKNKQDLTRVAYIAKKERFIAQIIGQGRQGDIAPDSKTKEHKG